MCDVFYLVLNPCNIHINLVFIIVGSTEMYIFKASNLLIVQKSANIKYVVKNVYLKSAAS